MRVRTARRGDAAALEALYKALVVGDRNIHVEEDWIAELERSPTNRLFVLDAVEQEARSAHCTKLMLLSTATRVEAHAFFRRLGFDAERKRGFAKYLK